MLVTFNWAVLIDWIQDKEIKKKKETHENSNFQHLLKFNLLSRYI